MKKSPLAPKKFPVLPPIGGVRLAAVECGMKYKNRDDLMLAVMDDDATVAGVLTQSAVVGAPVEWCRRGLSLSQSPRALIVNAGNSNVATGAVGRRHVRDTCEAVAAALGCATEQVFVASTGVIGEPLAVHKIIDAVPKLTAQLRDDAWQKAARAIGTTDTFPKVATAQASINGCAVTVNGIAKGSGMIEPNMATMLAFVFTDAKIPRAILQALLTDAVASTFNAISVDGDTSTSDTCLLFASAAACNVASDSVGDYDDFRRALLAVMTELAVQVVRDGEGAEKLITIDVCGGEDDADAKLVAKSIANSPLVKTAIAGGDANWGRIMMAIGKAGARVDAECVAIKIGGIAVAENGVRVDEYDETKIAQHLSGREIFISVDLGLANGNARVWTCDLTHGYIKINADYRT